MNRVVSNYFDTAHAGLLRQKPGSASHVQLPSLKGGLGSSLQDASEGDGDRELTEFERGMPALQESKSLATLEYSREQALVGIQSELYEKTLCENSKMARKMRTLKDQLAVTSAKKEAFKVQAQRLELEFKKGREQTDTLQKELLDAKRESQELNKEAQEAIAMMTEMRKSHIAEVKLLQRGLAARGNDEKMRNRVNEMADLVDKVGRAVVQRDEAIRDKTAMQVQFTKAMKDLRSASEDNERLRKQVKHLGENLKEAKRKGQYAPPRTNGVQADDEDVDFEAELEAFEKRFTILEEGPAGLDILASNLSQDKHNLEKRIKEQKGTIQALNGTIENWQRLGAEKDQQVLDMNNRLDTILREKAIFEEQMVKKQREIAEQVEEERRAMEERIKELEEEYDQMVSATGGASDQASTKLGKELNKVHEHYGAKPAAEATAAVAAAPEGQGDWIQVAAAESVTAKTGESLKMSVYKCGDAIELRVIEPSTGGDETRIAVDRSVIQELDEADPWVDLFSRTGVDNGPQRKVVISRRIGQKELTLQPMGNSVLLTVHRYGANRYHIAGTDLTTQAMLDLTITEATMKPELEARLSACSDDEKLFESLTAALMLNEKGLALDIGGV